jgi:KaiC/GvpD/RAD55 family RecA-like ATPase
VGEEESLCPGCTRLGVLLLDKLLPRGIPRKSFGLIEGEGGSGKSFLLHLIVKYFLERGEEVIYLTLDDDPESLAEALKSHDIDVDNYIKNEKLLIVDGCAARYGVESGVYTYERLTSLEPEKVARTLESILDSKDVKGRGLLVIDSINPFFIAYEPTMIYDLLCRIRSSISKRRKVLTLATLHTTSGLFEEPAQILEFMLDLVILVGYHVRALEAGAPVRRLLIKKAKGVPVSYGWVSYMITDAGPVEVKVKEGGQ